MQAPIEPAATDSPRNAPRRVLDARGPWVSQAVWPLHDAASSRAAEQAALSRSAPEALMERAGLACARLALALAPHARHVQVWCGPGHNGGDGRIAARHLAAPGRDVELLQPGESPRDSAGMPDLVLDSLLGLGASRAPAGSMADAIVAINRLRTHGVPVLAIDLPSGLHPDTGALLGADAVRASATLSLLTLKPGLFTHQGRDHAGTVWFDTLGAEAGPATAWLAGAPPARLRAHASHKGRHGDVVVVGGAHGMVGAAWLAARAALAAGAGRVYTSLLDTTAAALDPTSPELMSRSAWWREPPATLQSATAVAGCGGGDAIAAALPPLLSHTPRLVLDADALNAIAADSALARLLHARATRGLTTLLTPHPLEAARLLGSTTAAVMADRLAAAQRLCERTSATVLLKGSGSVIAAPGAPPTINPTGNAALATAGTGDVLAGWAAGLWAQAPEVAATDIAIVAAWQHGHAADAWPPAAEGSPLRASVLIEQLCSLSRSAPPGALAPRPRPR